MVGGRQIGKMDLVLWKIWMELPLKILFFMTDASYHTAWVNSLALAEANITKDTPDPERWCDREK